MYITAGVSNTLTKPCRGKENSQYNHKTEKEREKVIINQSEIFLLKWKIWGHDATLNTHLPVVKICNLFQYL